MIKAKQYLLIFAEKLKMQRGVGAWVKILASYDVKYGNNQYVTDPLYMTHKYSAIGYLANFNIFIEMLFTPVLYCF